MDQRLKWLTNTEGLPVPAGYIVLPTTPEVAIRAAYEELKLRVKVHFVAVRGPTHAVLNVIGPDTLILRCGGFGRNRRKPRCWFSG